MDGKWSLTAIFKTTVPTVTVTKQTAAVDSKHPWFTERTWSDRHNDGLSIIQMKPTVQDLEAILSVSPTGNSIFNRQISSSSPVGSFAKDHT
jgi:hypothetical protein